MTSTRFNAPLGREVIILTSIVTMIVVILMVFYNLGLTYHYAPAWDGPDWTYKSVGNEIKRLWKFE